MFLYCILFDKSSFYGLYKENIELRFIQGTKLSKNMKQGTFVKQVRWNSACNENQRDFCNSIVHYKYQSTVVSKVGGKT